MAEITFIGNVGKIGEKRTVGPEGAQYSVFDMWVGENLSRSNVSDDKKKTAWRKVTLWRGYADSLYPHMKIGRRIEVRGIAGETKHYLRGNEVVSYLPVNATKIYFMDAKREENVPPEDVLGEEPSTEPVAVPDDELPFGNP